MDFTFLTIWNGQDIFPNQLEYKVDESGILEGWFQINTERRSPHEFFPGLSGDLLRNQCGQGSRHIEQISGFQTVKRCQIKRQRGVLMLELDGPRTGEFFHSVSGGRFHTGCNWLPHCRGFLRIPSNGVLSFHVIRSGVFKTVHQNGRAVLMVFSSNIKGTIHANQMNLII